MKWLQAIRGWFLTNDFEERPYSSDDRFGTTEVLECRLVLGALAAEPSSAVALSSTAATPDSATTALAQGSLSVQPQSASDNTVSMTSPLQQSNRSLEQPNNSPPQFVQQDSGEISEDLPSGSTGGTSISTVLNSTSTSILLNSFDLPAGLAGPQSQSPTAGKPSDANPVTLATPSVPLTSITPSNVSSPPVAIDRALTAVNQNVFVSPDQISAVGNRVAVASASTDVAAVPAWFGDQAGTSVIRYDFRDENGVNNEISNEQIAATELVLDAWSQASDGKLQFQRDTQAPDSQIVNIGVGDLSALGLTSNAGGTLGTASHALVTVDGTQASVGTIWLDRSESWSAESAGAPDSVDFSTVMAHEVGHVVGLEDDLSQPGIMNPNYSGAQNLSGIAAAFASPRFISNSRLNADGYVSEDMLMGFPQLSQSEVSTLLQRASVATPSNNAIIAIVDRNGTILGVRAEQDVLDTIGDPATLAFAIDGAVSEARTAAFFANDTAPLTSRTVQNLSQTTMLQREVEANPNSTDPTQQGPGFIAPIGIGGHFPTDIAHTPHVDLFNIQASNRDSTVVPGTDRFNVDPIHVPVGQTLVTPISYGTDAGIPGDSQNRGIATLPGGIPIFRDTNGDGVGDTLVGGIGVFFPGADGYATHSQGFIAGQGQTTTQRMNADQALEAEFMALAAVGGSTQAAQAGVSNAVVGTLDGVAPVSGIDLPFGFLTLNGIALEVVGSTPGTKGPQDLINRFIGVAGTGADSGSNQTLGGAVTLRDGASVPEGYLVTPHTSASSSLTTADMTQIIDAGIAASNEVRAAIRLGADRRTGADGVRMTFAITDTKGEVLALYRMQDGTVFSIDVAVAKARNVAYYADPSQLQIEDQVAVNPGGPNVDAGTAFTNRTFRFLAEPRYPSGVDGTAPPAFSILNDASAAGFNPTTGENLAGPAAAAAFTSVMGHDVFNPGTNFHDTTDTANQNGIIFFPGSTPLYKNGVLVGGLGVSGDGVDQDDVVTYLAAQGFLPDGVTTDTADEVFVNGVRLPFQKFNRNPFG